MVEEKLNNAPDWAMPQGAVQAFSESLEKIQALVREKLRIDLSSPSRSGLKAQEEFLQDLQAQFGRNLLAVYRLGLFDALPEEISSLTAELEARGISKDLFRDMANAWIVAIHGSVPSSHARHLAQPLEWVKKHAAKWLAETLLPAVMQEGPEAPFLVSLLAQRPEEAERHVLSLLRSGVTTERICGETIFPALKEIGILWQHNRLTVSEEHIATGILRHVVYNLFRQAPKVATKPHGVVVSCAPGDEHELGAEIFALYLETKGWPVLFLGHSAPEKDVLLAIMSNRPFALLLSATLLAVLPAALDLMERVRLEVPGIRIIAGGRAAVRAERAFAGVADAVARTLEESHALLTKYGEMK